MTCFAVVIIGYSIGGLIGIHLAEKYGVDALITINAPIFISDFRRLVGMLRCQLGEIRPFQQQTGGLYLLYIICLALTGWLTRQKGS
jgi:pimeloyl-ACP methyl ester carboxylesterase